MTPDALTATLLRAVWHHGPLAFDDLCTQVVPGETPLAVASALTPLKRQQLVEYMDADRGVVVGPSLDAEDAARQHYAQLRGCRACRVCGCSDDWACPGGCAWAGPDLCTHCMEED